MVSGALVFAVWLALPMGDPFPPAYSRVVYDAQGELLRATLSPDQQIRFPLTSDTLPAKYVTAVTACEDRRFFMHPGIDPFSLVKALFVNISHGRRVRGASTIAMQVIRLSKPCRRTYFNKAIECAVALKLSFHFSKRDILALYAAQAPMGGNTVGLEAASWRYFGKSLSQITWAQAALFTVLPNAPSLLNPQKKRPLLKAKRDRALRLLWRRGSIDSMTCALSCREPLPLSKNCIPFTAPHFTELVLKQSPKAVVATTLDSKIQQQAMEIISVYRTQYAAQGIHNIAALIVHTSTGAIAGYIGSADFADTVHDGRVDGIMANRSTGSLLKPFLAARVLDRGPYILESMLQDVPTFYGSFYPQNASREYAGLVTMQQMLIQSLNVPAVRLLYWYGVNDFYTDLKNCGLSGLFRSSDAYGLSLILGGAESSLFDLIRLFNGLGNLGAMRPLYGLEDTTASRLSNRDTSRFCSEGAAWLILNTLNKLNRPGSEYYWQFFTGQVPVAWKTGTSFGQKDAWAIGVNSQWTIGVWVGNFNGEGNMALGGAQSAGPILFQLFNALSDKSRSLWFKKPEYDLVRFTVCKASGLLPGSNCADTITAEKPRHAYQSQACPFHRSFLAGRKKGFTLCSRCWAGIDTMWKVKVVYPPSVRSVLASRGFAVDSLPGHNPQCPVAHPRSSIEIVYPVHNISIIVPRNLSGAYEKVVFKAEYQRPGGHLFWYLNGDFIAETINRHTVAVDLPQNIYKLAVQDAEGETVVVRFKAYRKEETGNNRNL
jgi:penicillin-binding protein 1C